MVILLVMLDITYPVQIYLRIGSFLIAFIQIFKQSGCLYTLLHICREAATGSFSCILWHTYNLPVTAFIAYFGIKKPIGIPRPKLLKLYGLCPPHSWIFRCFLQFFQSCFYMLSCLLTEALCWLFVLTIFCPVHFHHFP